MKIIAVLLLSFMPVLGNAALHTYEIQHAGYAFDKSDARGSIDYAQFVREFRAFPWAKEVGSNTGGSEPTISVRNPVSGIDLWVSVVGQPNEYAFLVGMVQPRKGKPASWVTAYILEKPEWVEEAFALYFAGEIQKLNANFSRLPPFLDQEARQ